MSEFLSSNTEWNQERIDTLIELVKRNLTADEIRTVMDIPVTRIRYKVRQLRLKSVIRGIGKYPENDEGVKAAEEYDITTAAASTLAEGTDAFKESVMESESSGDVYGSSQPFIEETNRNSHGPTIKHRVSDEIVEGEDDMDAIWSFAEQKSEKKLRKIEKEGVYDIRFDDDRPIAISFISDQHIAPNSACDFTRMRSDAELIRRTDGLYACLAGDGVDNHIKHRAAIIAAQSTPDEQWLLMDWYLRMFSEKILVMICGNHDAWTAQVGGTDMMKHIAAKNKLHYSPHAAFINLRLGKVDYKLAFRHQYRFNSQMNQTHCVKQWYRMGERQFDIGVIGHHHEASIEAFQAHGEVRWAARPGAYQIQSSYSQQYGFNKAKPTCPTFILFPKHKEIIGFWDVKHAVIMLNALRKD
jgi:predicted phosphodiesterase